jgi:hypothetical protein
MAIYNPAITQPKIQQQNLPRARVVLKDQACGGGSFSRLPVMDPYVGGRRNL